MKARRMIALYALLTLAGCVPHNQEFNKTSNSSTLNGTYQQLNRESGVEVAANQVRLSNP